MQNRIQKNAGLLAQLLKNLTAERFKSMAKEESLSRYLAAPVDPVLLMDLNLQVERDAIQLTEMSLLALVTSERMRAELKRTATRLQKSFQSIFGDESIVDFASDSLIEKRIQCLRTRVDFYNPFLSCSSEGSNIFDLARQAFLESERFETKLKRLLESDQDYLQTLVKETAELQRFLAKKQTDIEFQWIQKNWREFQHEAFKKPPELR